MTTRVPALLAIGMYCALAVSQPAAAQDWIYSAKKGDTLWDLCIKYSNKKGCWIDLGKYNAITNDRMIQPGTDIRIPKAWLSSLPEVGRVLTVRGNVEYDEKSSGDLIPLVSGQALALGSRIISGQGSATIALENDAGTVLLRENSELELMSLGRSPDGGVAVELELLHGEADADVKSDSGSRFQIKTPSAIAAVRGTKYRVRTAQGSTRSEVLSGSVSVKSEGAVLLPAGFGVLAQTGKPIGKAHQLLPAPVFNQKRIDSTLPVAIEWQGSPEAISWQLDIVTENGKELVSFFRPLDPRIVINELPEGCYRAVARGIDQQSFNGLEGGIPLCVVATLDAPLNTSIESGEDKNEYRILWDALETTERYRVEVATDPTFNTVLVSETVSGTTLSVTPPGNSGFAVRVTAMDSHGNSGVPGDIVEHRRKNHLVSALAVAAALAIILL